MSLNFPIFQQQFPKYTMRGLAFVHGGVGAPERGAQLTIGKTADILYYRFFEKLRPGMSMEQCFEAWKSLVTSSAGFNQWDAYRQWYPNEQEWWYGEDGLKYHLRDERVCLLSAGAPHRAIPLSNDAPNAYKGLVDGLSLEEARAHLMQQVKGCKRWAGIYAFEPVTTSRAPKTPRVYRTEVAKNTGTKGYDRSQCPPLISTTLCDVRVMFPTDMQIGDPDQVEVVLYALTAIWANPERTRVNPEVKGLVNSYFEFAYRQMRTNKYIREHPTIYKRLKPRNLRVTKDCCVECDFVLEEAVK